MNLDYLFFVQSGLLFMLTVAAAGLARIEPERPWRWLALFGLLSIFRSWVGIVAADLGTLPVLVFINDALILASAAALIEFAGRHHVFATAGYRRVFYLALVAATVFSAWRWGAAGAAWKLFGLTVCASVWASRLLARYGSAGNLRAPSRYSHLAAWVLPVHAVTSTLPANRWLGEGFAVPGIPPHVIPALVAALFSLAVYGHNALRQQQLLPANAARSWRQRRMICVAVVWVVVIVGWLAAGIIDRRQDAAMRSQILGRTQLAAAAIDPQLLPDLRWDESDVSDLKYQRLKTLMMSLHAASPDLRFTMLTGLRDGRAYFLVDSEPPDSPDYSPPGQLYGEATPDYLRALARPSAFVHGPIEDRWGTWISGSAPVARFADGRAINLDLDIAAADWANSIRRARLPVVLIALLICVLILGFFQMQELQRESSLQVVLSEQRNSSLVEGSPDCVQMFDVDGRYLAVNQNGLHALGVAEFDLIGRRFADIWPVAVRPLIDAAVKRTVEGEPMSFEADYVRPDGRIVTWRVATNPVRDEEGAVRSFVGICVDLSEHKRAEQALRAAKDAAEAATRAKSEFLAVMSHELRTPLAGVIGMLDLLRCSPAETLRRKYTDVARDSAGTLLRLLDDILDMAKIESGKLSLETIAFRPRHEFRHLCEAARLRAEAKGLDFKSHIHPSVPEVLFGDPTRLRQVLGNLQNNALKFTEAGGVYVEISARALDGADPRTMLMIAVRDTGVGIPDAHRARLFEKFQQGDLSTTRRFGGTGLGLSIVKALADMLQGSVTVESEPGRGSTFTFEAPFAIGTAADYPADDASLPTAPARSGVRLRILCAEDDTVNRIVAEALIKRMGHDIEFVENGHLALECLRRKRFDLVLMDGRMPVMDGFQATRAIRSGSAGVLDPEIYICAATANVSESDRGRCREIGMNDYVTKPLDQRVLFAAFNRAIVHLRERGVALVAAEDPIGAPGMPRGLSEAELLAVVDEASSPPSTVSAPDFPQETLPLLLSIFWREAPKRFAALHSAFEERDCATLGNMAHALKSAARYVQAHRLGELVEEIETLADRNDLTAIGRVLPEADREFEHLREQMPAPATT